MMAVNILAANHVFHRNRDTQLFEQAGHANFIKTLKTFSGKMMVKIFAPGMIDELSSDLCCKQSKRSNAEI